MATQYEIEHNVQFAEPRRGRRVDMSSFFALLNTLSDSDQSQHRPHATPTPVDHAHLFRLLQDQLLTLQTTSPDEGNRDFLEQLISGLEGDINDPPREIHGVSQEFIDTLDRVTKRRLKPEDDCAICKIPYLEDEYPLVVQLPCAGKHRYDLECVGPWLRSKGTCPMCREQLGKRKQIIVEDEEEDENPDMLYS
ncbi:uncharacterized protein J7T54_003141 [Emericellopsis cladophorae]|uniref:RING-type domain-containing protein n=1 Tax=Emericellopsis cladophorae TaxID=2686198 RepID=A0A9P9XZX7_9HYPO|nr:uncharacterized protein J7T54_003141 [Emericellopsis cladophorae]KAI6780999.1 hypothetical protein J7T54_003141 [Emericellopsis cladophorae]